MHADLAAFVAMERRVGRGVRLPGVEASACRTSHPNIRPFSATKGCPVVRGHGRLPGDGRVPISAVSTGSCRTRKIDTLCQSSFGRNDKRSYDARVFENDDVSPALRASYAVLFAVSGAGHAGVAVPDICRVTGLTPRTVYRHLRSLRQLGLVEPGAQLGRFQIGAITAGLAVRTTDQRTFLRVAQEITDRVTEKALEPAHVTVYDHGTAATVVAASEQVTCATEVVPIVLGSRRPAHASASGKVFLADSTSARTAYLMRPLESFTDYTVTDPDAFLANCRLIQEQGYATDVQENTLGVSCVAVPVRGPRGRVAASLVISTNKPDLSADRQGELLDILRPAATEFARRIGADQ